MAKLSDFSYMSDDDLEFQINKLKRRQEIDPNFYGKEDINPSGIDPNFYTGENVKLSEIDSNFYQNKNLRFGGLANAGIDNVELPNVNEEGVPQDIYRFRTSKGGWGYTNQPQEYEGAEKMDLGGPNAKGGAQSAHFVSDEEANELYGGYSGPKLDELVNPYLLARSDNPRALELLKEYEIYMNSPGIRTDKERMMLQEISALTGQDPNQNTRQKVITDKYGNTYTVGPKGKIDKGFERKTKPHVPYDKTKEGIEFLERQKNYREGLSEKDNRTNDQKDYEYAQKQGFQGSMIDYQKALKSRDPVQAALALAQKDNRVTDMGEPVTKVAKEYYNMLTGGLGKGNNMGGLNIPKGSRIQRSKKNGNVLITYPDKTQKMFSPDGREITNPQISSPDNKRSDVTLSSEKPILEDPNITEAEVEAVTRNYLVSRDEAIRLLQEQNKERSLYQNKSDQDWERAKRRLSNFGSSVQSGVRGILDS